ncbi:hypothetical protein Pelo_9417 [Pelomyxa schiedti]|nr:hypothetical protein Pelo_9417 [Pelomyxa schiedti]
MTPLFVKLVSTCVADWIWCCIIISSTVVGQQATSKRETTACEASGSTIGSLPSLVVGRIDETTVPLTDGPCDTLYYKVTTADAGTLYLNLTAYFPSAVLYINEACDNCINWSWTSLSPTVNAGDTLYVGVIPRSLTDTGTFQLCIYVEGHGTCEAHSAECIPRIV